MIKINKKLAFGIFAVCLFLIGYKLYELIEYGFSEGKDLIFENIFSISLIMITFYFGYYLYGNHNKFKDL